MYLYGLILQGGELPLNGQEGDEQVVVATGWQAIQSQCKPGPEGMHTRPCGTLGSLDGSLGPTHNQSCVIWPRSLFCYGQVIPLTR